MGNLTWEGIILNLYLDLHLSAGEQIKDSCGVSICRDWDGNRKKELRTDKLLFRLKYNVSKT